jgi:hypothetical protein
MVELRRQGEIVDAMDGLWNQLLTGKPQAQRTVSFNLYQAALAVAVHGCDEVSAQLAARAATWRAGRLKRTTDETKRFWTARAVKQSSKPKSRASHGENAYEEVAKQEGISPSTAEKRRYRKPRK